MRTRGTAARWGTRLVTSALATTLLVASIGLGGLRPGTADLSPAATNTYLCTGYAGCISSGYSDAGYGAASSKMYWNMYSGHNCTNYAAYRVIKAGGPATRPWSGLGNASEWGLRMASITDTVPNVGAIAWWARYDNGSGSAGHVAYVERVISPTEIVISEDAWGGTFHWRRLTKDSGRWPTGFIHFTDKAVAARTTPAVTGTPAVGQTLGVTPLTWTNQPTSVSYDWVVGGVSTGVATPTFTLRPADLGKSVVVWVAGVRAGYTAAVVQSPPTAAVAKGTFVQQQPVAVDGDVLVDNTLTASPGVWSPAPTASSWRWYADGVRLTGVDGPQLPLTADLVGRSIAVVPVARADGYTAAVGGRVTVGTVLQGVITVTQGFQVSGVPQVGQVLTATGGAFQPADAGTSYQWLRDGVAIPGATAATYAPTGADAGRQVTVKVTLTRANFAPATQAVPVPGRVVSPPRVVVRTSGTGGVARIVVKVRAPGVSPVTGRAVVRVNGVRKVVRLKKGNAVVSVPVPRKGTRPVVVRYEGSAAVPAKRVDTSVTIR